MTSLALLSSSKNTGRQLMSMSTYSMAARLIFQINLKDA